MRIHGPALLSISAFEIALEQCADGLRQQPRRTPCAQLRDSRASNRGHTVNFVQDGCKCICIAIRSVLAKRVSWTGQSLRSRLRAGGTYLGTRPFLSLSPPGEAQDLPVPCDLDMCWESCGRPVKQKSRCSLMSYRRYVSALLLLTCGLPLAVGPHWHRAGLGIGCGISHSTDEFASAEEESEAPRDPCGGHCCSTQIATRSHDSEPTEPVADQESHLESDHCCDCVICHFYASSFSLSYHLAPQSDGGYSPAFSEKAARTVAERVGLPVARGPPVLC